MKSFQEYREYLVQNLNHLIINNDNDVASFTKFLLNYGKMALKYYPDDIYWLCNKYSIYGLKENELIVGIKEISFIDTFVVIKTLDKKIYKFPRVSVFNELEKVDNLDSIDFLILLSISLTNSQQELFQLVNFLKNKK